MTYEELKVKGDIHNALVTKEAHTGTINDNAITANTSFLAYMSAYKAFCDTSVTHLLNISIDENNLDSVYLCSYIENCDFFSVDVPSVIHNANGTVMLDNVNSVTIIPKTCDVLKWAKGYKRTVNVAKKLIEVSKAIATMKKYADYERAGNVTTCTELSTENVDVWSMKKVKDTLNDIFSCFPCNVSFTSKDVRAILASSSIALTVKDSEYKMSSTANIRKAIMKIASTKITSETFGMHSVNVSVCGLNSGNELNA